jgi:quinol monooxygenase YgiN
MSQQVDVVAHFRALPGKEAELRALLESFVAPTRQEEGCLRYDLFIDLKDPLQFTFIEEWTTEAALDKHGQSAHINAGRPKFPELTESRWVQRLTRIL